MEEIASVLLCTQCKVNPRADQRPEATNRWCSACNSRYRKEWSVLRMDRKERTGFVKGREEMRKIIVAEFTRLGINHFSGDEVAHLVNQMPGPQVADSNPDDKD